MACADILADLAAEYERSRAVLEQLEDTLKDRTYLPATDAPEATSPLSLPDLAEERGEEDEQELEQEQEEEEEEQQATNKAASQHTGLRAKLVNFFARNRSQSTRFEKTFHSGDDIEEPRRRMTVVDTTGLLNDNAGAFDGPRRSVTFQPAGPHTLLPTSALQRSAPRASLEIHQHQLVFGDAASPGRVSSGNLAAFPARRRSLDPLGAQGQGPAQAPGGRRNSTEISTGHRLSQRSYQATLEANNAGAGAAAGSTAPTGRLSIGQHPLYGSSNPGNASLSTRHPQQQQQQQQPGSDASTPQLQLQLQQLQQLQLVHGNEDSLRRRSVSRRGSDGAAGVSRGSSFNAAHGQPQPLGSPQGSPSGCLSPTSSIAGGGLPTLVQSGGAGARVLRRDNSSTCHSFSPLRAHSLSSMGMAASMSAAAAAAAAADDDDDDDDDDAGALYDRAAALTATSVSATGIICSPAAAAMVGQAAGSASGACSPGGSSPQVQLPQLMQRTRSVHLSTNSPLRIVSSARRLQSCRFLDCADGQAAAAATAAAPEDINGGRRQSLGQYDANGAGVSGRVSANGGRVSGGGGMGGGGGSFRGTMHLI